MFELLLPTTLMAFELLLPTTLMALVGLALGLLGSGGSILTLPVLVYVAHVPGHQAVGMSLVIVGGTSLLGCFLNRRRGALDLRAALLFAGSGIPGAWVGAGFSHLVSARVLLLSFGALLLVVGWRMLMPDGPAQPARQCKRLPSLLGGLGVGLLTGFLGVGGGIIILPALVLFAGLEMKVAVGTSLAVIAANCLAALVGQLHYVHFDLPPALGFLAAAAAGMFGGQALVPRVSSTWLRRAFAWGIIGLGALLLFRNALGPEIPVSDAVSDAGARIAQARAPQRTTFKPARSALAFCLWPFPSGRPRGNYSNSYICDSNNSPGCWAGSR
jgi:hypothetical protein